jgi:hypothetical protein
MPTIPTTWFRVFWAAWFSVGLAVELYAAIVRHQSGDTLTEQIRPLLSHPILWFTAAGFAYWAIRHLFFGRA